MKIILSIIILNYNTKNLTLEGIKSIEKNYPTQTEDGSFEVIVADNASPDNSLQAFEDYKKITKIKNFQVCDNKGNVGFSKGNNLAIQKAGGAHILILNPDTIVPEKTLTYMLDFMETHPDAGAATCKIKYLDGTIDRNCLRGFPTPWNAFCHFSGIAKFFPKNKFFSGYLQTGWRDMDKVQEVEAIEGAFMMIPRRVGEKLGWFDEDYFFYGEDLQLCLDIHKAGYKIYYVPQISIIHHGGASSGIKKQSKQITTADIETKKRVQNFRFKSMKIFFKKNYSDKYPFILRWFVYKGIDLLYSYKLNISLKKV